MAMPPDDLRPPIPADQIERASPPTAPHSDVLTTLRTMYEGFTNGIMTNQRRFLLGKQLGALIISMVPEDTDDYEELEKSLRHIQDRMKDLVPPSPTVESAISSQMHVIELRAVRPDGPIDRAPPALFEEMRNFVTERDFGVSLDQLIPLIQALVPIAIRFGLLEQEMGEMEPTDMNLSPMDPREEREEEP